MAENARTSERERGFLLIADMEGSTRSKFLLGEEGAFAALREHNLLIMEQCRKAAPVSGVILNSLGDAVVAKFPVPPGEEGAGGALESCLRAARTIVGAFERLPEVRGENGVTFPLRTKLTLQYYDAFRYGRRDERPDLAEELVGPDVDAAFRISAVSWRLQVLVTERFMGELVRYSDAPDRDTPGLVSAARAAREAAARGPRPMEGICVPLTTGATTDPVSCWITDAREIARLKGLPGNQRVFLLSFEPPAELLARNERDRLTIKVRQDHHAVILASVSLEPGRNDDYIAYVVDLLADSTDGNWLESELTLCAAAKIYGEFDFFFRVSCIDDESLRRFFDAIHDDQFGVDSVEVRSTVAGRFRVNPDYERILSHFRRRPFEVVLTWFQRDPEGDLFTRFVDFMERGTDGPVRPVEILETGEVIHHKPVYCIFICDSLAAYAEFFEEAGLNPTACRSHIGQIRRPSDAQLRYSLMGGVYVGEAPSKPTPQTGSG